MKNVGNSWTQKKKKDWKTTWCNLLLHQNSGKRDLQARHLKKQSLRLFRNTGNVLKTKSKNEFKGDK